MASKSYALVTGAASGMGRHYCLQLAKAGYGILAVDINGEGLDSLGRELDGYAFFKICLDLTLPDAAQQISNAVQQKDAQVEVLVNNAGMIFTTAIFGAVDTPLFGFPEKATRLMLATGVMVSPQKAVSRALDAMFGPVINR